MCLPFLTSPLTKTSTQTSQCMHRRTERRQNQLRGPQQGTNQATPGLRGAGLAGAPTRDVREHGHSVGRGYDAAGGGG